MISEEERFKKYVKEQCKNCKNREKDLCEIHTSVLGETIVTKCEFYEKKKEI